jgi:hypothetical protein
MYLLKRELCWPLFSDKPSPSSYGEDPIVVIDLIGKYLANAYFFFSNWFSYFPEISAYICTVCTL